jgi:hypothetical protein
VSIRTVQAIIPNKQRLNKSMKHQFIKVILFTAGVMVLVNCKRFGKDHNAYFFTDVENNGGHLTLFIDGKNKGELPNLKTSVSPGNDTVLTQALHLILSPGRYKLEAKDDQGNVKCSGLIKFRSNSLNNSCTMGSQATSRSGNTIVAKLSY